MSQERICRKHCNDRLKVRVQHVPSVETFQQIDSLRRDILVQTIQSARTLQYKNIQSLKICQCGNQSVRIFQYKLFSQQGHSSTKHSVTKDMSVWKSVSEDIPVQIIQSASKFQYKKFSH
jgi:hypothetical protein